MEEINYEVDSNKYLFSEKQKVSAEIIGDLSAKQFYQSIKEISLDVLTSTNLSAMKESTVNRSERLIKERAKRKPIAYLLNKKFFWDSEFYVNENTLIPRPDTEVIIEEIFKLTKYKNKLNILDIGVGSGCILLTILKERKNFIGTGVDISKKSLDICKINAKNLDLNQNFQRLFLPSRHYLCLNQL